MGGRFPPLGIPLRLAILLLPSLLGGLVTLRALGWAQRMTTVESVPVLAITALAVPGQDMNEPQEVGPPRVEYDPAVEAVHERMAIASSREGERRPESVEPKATIDDLVPVGYRSLVLRTALRHHLDPRLLAAVIKLESRFDRTTVGTHGEVGLMQIMADTGAWLARYIGMESYDLRDDETSLELGATYLVINLREYGSVEQALAVYNGGPRAAAGWETNPYVRRVLQYYRGG